MTSPMSARMRNALKLSLSLACLWAIWHWIDLSDLALRFRTVALPPLAAAMILNLFLQFLNAIKIRLLFPEPRPALAGMLIVNLIAVFFSSFIPGGIGGEVARWAYMSRESGSKSHPLAAILLDRITGLWAQILLALAAWIWLVRGSAVSHPALGATVTAALLILGASLAAGIWGYRGLSKVLQKGVAWYSGRGGKGMAEEAPGVDASADIGAMLADLLSDRARCLRVALISVAYQLLVVATFLLVDRAIGGDLGWAQASLFLFCYTLILLLPVSLGNWGVSEGVLGILYHYAGSRSGTGVLISLLLRVMTLPAAFLGWFFFILRRPPSAAQEAP